MPEITFIFGPNNTFFFDCPKSWKFHNIPQTLRQLFNSSMSPAWRIAQPYCLALGPQINAPESIWYCGCRTVAGEEKLFYSQVYFDANYPELARWTKTIPNAPRQCFITFGAGLAYFACAPGHGSVWAGVPSDLTDKVQKAYDTPSHVSLGVDQAWFVMWADGYYAWNFKGHYGNLSQTLNEAPPRSVSYLAISPYNREHYFIAFKDRTVKYNFTGAPEWIPQMQQVFHEWQAEMMQRQYMPTVPEVPQQFQQYLPNPARPAYVAAHYASSPAPQGPLPQFIAELPPASPPMQSPPPAPAIMSFMAELPGDVPTVVTPPLVSPSPSVASPVASSPAASLAVPRKPSANLSIARPASIMSTEVGAPQLTIPMCSADLHQTTKKKRSIFGWKHR